MRTAHPQAELRGSDADQQREYAHQERRHTLSKDAENQDAKQRTRRLDEIIGPDLRRLGRSARSRAVHEFHRLNLYAIWTRILDSTDYGAHTVHSKRACRKKDEMLSGVRKFYFLVDKPFGF